MNSPSLNYQSIWHRRCPISAYRPNQSGFTLIEILIAVLVLSFGLLGLAMLQAAGLKYNSDSYTRTQATLVAYNIMDRIRANRTGADNGNYVASAKGTAQACGASWPGCTTEADLADYDKYQWYTLQDRVLPPAAIPSSITRAVTTTAAGRSLYTYTITVRWNERGTDLAQSWDLQICQMANNC